MMMMPNLAMPTGSASGASLAALPVDRSALELAERSEWALLARMLSVSPDCAEECDDFGMMPLHWACTARDVEPRVVRKLVDAFPVAAKLKNKGGLLPLHIAIKAKAPLEVLQLLVRHHEDSICEETPTGETPAELAESCGLPREAIAFLGEKETQLRASGRMPPRPSRFRPLSSTTLSLATSGSSHNLSALDSMRGSEALSLSSNTVIYEKRSEMSTLRAGPFRQHALPPRWQLDKKCNVCQLKFSYFKSRHHCRNCGLSVCGTHSSQRLPLRHFGLETPQRVCIMCYDDLRENGHPPSAVVNMFAPHLHREGSFASSRTVPTPLLDRQKDDKAPARPSLAHSQSVTYIGSSSRSQKSTFLVEHELDETNENAMGHLNTHMNYPYHASDVSQGTRPRAQTEHESKERLSAVKEQVRELQQHVRDLQDQKERMKEAIDQGNRMIEHAVRDKHTQEKTIQTIRGDRIIDVSRVSPDDEADRDHLSSSHETLSSVDELVMPDDTALNMAATCSYLGLALFEKGDYAAAIVEFRKSVELNQQDPDVWFHLARALYQFDEYDEAESALDAEKKKVVAEWVGVEEAQKEYNRKRETFEKLLLERFQFLPLDEVVTFNVGGQLYRSTVKVWTRDRFSVLAQLCTTKPKLPKLCIDEDAYFFDRDFWIFQFIYAFLRENVLPDSLDILRELYFEASFYRIGLLRHAIEAKMIGDDASEKMEYTNVKYEGGKSFGRFCGYGELDLPDGNRYEGEFFNGQFHGEFFNGQFHGRGTLFFREGKLEGTWQHGKGS
ncbi:hypothetical protein ATCC90586_002416 [Pythium insidiosum]|nr:hypothetical protein ATCC90586_002416 [Pythium insidiosum]